jgi:hypothetical protein
LLVALVAAAISWFLIFGLGSGSCVDSFSGIPGAGGCTAGPLVGWPAAWLVGIIGGAVTVFSLVQAFWRRG